MKKVKYFKLKGSIYSNNLPKVMTKPEAKSWVRDWLDVKRLPNGVEFH
tara:strand:- start:122 stop:265 length:144 start_codon:yes stop_codon:yes gene_type:complete